MSGSIKNREALLKAFGNHLKQIRESKGLTSEDLAHRCRTAKTTISRFENGHHSPGIDQLALIANGLEISLSELLQGFDFSIEVERED